MRILLDLQGCQSKGSRPRGIGRYSLALAQALVRNGPSHEFWLLLNAAFPETLEPIRRDFEGLIPPDRIRCFHVPPGCAEGVADDLWRMRCAEEVRRHAIRAIAPDLVHVSSMFEGLADDCAVRIDPADGIPVAATVYDFIPFLNADRYLADERTRAWYMRKVDSLKAADLLLGISESASNEAREVLRGARGEILNISSASDPALFHPDGPAAAASRLGIAKPYVMYTGGANWRKNLEGLVEAFARLPTHVREPRQLVLVCHAEAHTRTQILAIGKRAGLPDGAVVFTGYVSDEDLAQLYRGCELFVFPSLHEGFGLPALEAMMCGAPVIASNASSVPEVIGREDALFDPSDPRAIAALMQRALEDASFRESLRAHAPVQARRFSWDTTAQRALEAMERVAKPRVPAAPATASRRPRLAMHTPVPPAESGIAQYTTELLPHLERHYDIELVSVSPEARLPAELTHIPVRSIEWFREHAGGYDRIAYQFGNSMFHAHMFGLLREFPGAVVLHDFFLSGVLAWMEDLGHAPGILDRELFGSHGPQALAFSRDHGREAAVRRYPANRFVLERATGVIVHSDFAMGAARQWYGEDAADGWRRIRHLRTVAAPGGRDGARRELGASEGDLLVCTFGHVGATKQTVRLMRAWMSSSLARNPRARLVLVGKNARPAYGDQVQALVRANLAQFSITGFADRELYERHLRAADFAVQLRTDSRGETSGAVLDCLAWGVPLLLNANGPMAEYPADVVSRLADDFTDAELVAALERLAGDAGERARLAAAGPRWVAQNHDPADVARQYHEAIECFAAAPHRPHYWSLVDAVADLGAPARDDDLLDAAVAIAATTLPEDAQSGAPSSR